MKEIMEQKKTALKKRAVDQFDEYFEQKNICDLNKISIR